MKRRKARVKEFEEVMTCYLKRVLPFLLTLTFGLALGSLFRPAPRPFYTTRLVGLEQSYEHQGCRFRARAYANSTPLSIDFKPLAYLTDGARRNGLTNVAQPMMVEFRSDGTIGEVRPTTMLPYGLTQVAVEAAKKIKFTPSKYYGEPVSETRLIEYAFED